MKKWIVVFSSIVLVTVSFFLFSKYYIDPGLANIDSCITDSSTMMKLSTEKLQKISDKADRLSYFCSSDTEIANQLINCVERYKSENYLSFLVAKVNPRFKTTLIETVKTHNEMCSDTIAMPNYLEN